MYPRPLRAITSATLALASAFIGSGCSHQNDPVAESISTLAASGVAVYDSFSAATPIASPQGARSAMRFTRWQLANLLSMANAGGGMTGTTLDKMGQLNAGTKKFGFSVLVAAWLSGGKSDLAKYARSFMPKNADFKHASRLTYSLLVLTLFIGDIARTNAPPEKAGFDIEPFFAAPAMADGICSKTTGFIDGVIQDVIHALQFTNENNSTLISIFNTIVEVVVGVTLTAIKAALAPLLKIIAAVVGAISIVAMVASTLQVWHVTVSADPEKVTLGDQPVEGKLIATLDAPSLPVPPDVVDCASALGGIDLTTVNSKDAPVTWGPGGEIPGNADVVDKQATIQNDNTATLTYRTHAIPSTPAPTCQLPPTEQFVGEIFTTVTVQREDISKLQQALTDALLAQLPKSISDFIMPILNPFRASAEQSFKNLTASPVTNSGFSQLSKLEDACTPTPPPTKPPVSNASPQPSGSGDSNDIIGSWQCSIHGILHLASIGDTPEDTGTELVFHKNGTGASTVGAGHYTYISTGPMSGSLTYPRGTVPVTWKDHDHFTSPLIPPPNGRDWSMSCQRL